MRIIVEGPDGGGKTGLITRLQERYLALELMPRACTSEDGPIDELAEWVEQDWLKARRGFFIYDRHPLISELVYAPACNRLFSAKFDDPMWLRGQLLTFRTTVNTVIYCLPSLTTVIENARSNHGDTDHQARLLTNIVGIYQLYYLQAVNDNPRALIWNYEKHDFEGFCKLHFDYLLKNSEV